MKTPPFATAITSLRALARAVDRQPSTVCEWTKRPDWPFGTTPPWPDSLVPQITAWAERTLTGERRYGGAGDLIPAPGRAITLAEVLDPECMFWVGRLVPSAAARDALSMAAVNDLVVSFNTAHREAYRKIDARRDPMHPMPESATESYWTELTRFATDEDAAAVPEIVRAFHDAAVSWLSRHTKRKTKC